MAFPVDTFGPQALRKADLHPEQRLLLLRRQRSIPLQAALFAVNVLMGFSRNLADLLERRSRMVDEAHEHHHHYC